MQIVVNRNHKDSFIRSAASNTGKDVLKTTIPSPFAFSISSSSRVTPSARITQDTSARDATAWFVGYGEKNHKTLAFVVIIEGGGSGSINGGEVANTVLQAAFENIGG